MNIIIVLVGFLALAASEVKSLKKIVCYYDNNRTDTNNLYFEVFTSLTPRYLEPALDKCTHLVYGYVPINTDTNTLMDVDSDYVSYTDIAEFRNDNLKVLLSIGGEINDTDKYLALLGSQKARQTLIESTVDVMTDSGLDGIDIYWPFPKIEPEPEVIPMVNTRNGLDFNVQGSIGIGANIKFDDGRGPIPAAQVQLDLRRDFTALVREFRETIDDMGSEDNTEFLLSITVAPNTDYEKYYDVSSISEYVDYINLAIYDYATPDRFPTQADYIAPIYQPPNRKAKRNTNNAVSYWLKNGAPKYKIVLGIPPYGRSWKLDYDENNLNRRNANPPIEANGPSNIAMYTRTPGILSYSEICRYTSGKKPLLKKVHSEQFGSYAYSYCLPQHHKKDCEEGIWVSYVGPEAATQKANYVKSKRLGGIAVMDLSYDDFHGLCSVQPTNRTRFPVLTTVYDELAD